MASPSGNVLYLSSPSNSFQSESATILHPVIENLGHTYATPHHGQGYGFSTDIYQLNRPQVNYFKRLVTKLYTEQIVVNAHFILNRHNLPSMYFFCFLSFVNAYVCWLEFKIITCDRTLHKNACFLCIKDKRCFLARLIISRDLAKHSCAVSVCVVVRPPVVFIPKKLNCDFTAVSYWGLASCKMRR